MSTATGTMIFQQASTTGQFANSTLAFRDWGSKVSAALQAVGLVQTADTGQVNWTTVSAPGGNSTYTGYEIYRFNDSLQATAPVYIKFEYGSGPNGIAQASIRISVSTATSGAGTLNGVLVSATQQINGFNTSGETQPQPYYFCGDTSSIVFSFDAGPVSNGWTPSLMMIERTRNSDGTPNGDGLAFSYVQGYGGNLSTTYGNSGTIVMSFLTNSQSGSLRSLPIASPAVFGWWDGAGQDGTGTNFFPYLVAVPKQEAQMLSVLGCYAYAYPQQTTTTVVVNGSSHTYLALGRGMYADSLPGAAGSGWTSIATYGANQGVTSLLMRYE